MDSLYHGTFLVKLMMFVICSIWFLAMIRGGLSDGGIPGIIFSNGITWVENRRTSLHILRNFGLGKNVMEEMIDDEVNKLLQHIDDQWIDTQLDVSRFFNITVLGSLWRVLSGESLKVNDPKLIDLLKKTKLMTEEAGNPLVAITENFPLVFKFLNQIGIIVILKYIDEVVQFCKEPIESCKGQDIDGENPLTFIEAMLHKIQTTNDIKNPLHGKTGELNLLNVLIDFFFAGSDTTSNTLNWAMLFMITHPDVQSKVRKELLTKVGTNRVKMSDRELTPYTEAVIHEIQRKGNIAPLSVFHFTRSSITITGNLNIPCNTSIIPMIGEIMHDPEHFPNPMDFNPERYLITMDDGTLKFTPHPRVVPFGLGKRRCLGENLARMTLYKFFTAIIQKYQIVSGQDEPLSETPNGGFVQAPLPYKLKFLKL